MFLVGTMYVVDSSEGGLRSLPATTLTPAQAKAMASPLAQKILQQLAQAERYPKELARILRVHEQKVYYHIRRLQKAKLVVVSREDLVQGAHASYFTLAKPAFVVTFKPLEPAHKLPASEPGIFAPFVKDGVLDALVVIGNPDPHGPKMARSKDANYALDLMLLLGTFIGQHPKAASRLDTDVKDEDLQQNLIVIGGPIVNAVAKRLNPRMPVFFEEQSGWAVRSTLTGKLYTSEACGLVVGMRNPFNPEKNVLMIAGSRHEGTRALVLAFLKHIDQLAEGNRVDKSIHAKVIEGVDNDGDGIVDDARILE
jgi:DNA-binding transcriptional ArsR family regulator